jgi:alcohol dehydrogenase class IV
MAFSNARLGLVHGMAHPLGIAAGLSHGLICGLLLPAVMRFNMPVAEAKYARIAEMAGIPGDGSADALVQEVERLNSVMGLDARLPDLRIAREEWPSIVSQTLPSGSTKSNPRDVSAADIERILESL